MQAVISSIQKMGGVADHIPQVDDIVELITTSTKSEDVILVMSSGGFDGIHQKLLERL